MASEDPIEYIIASALTNAGIAYLREGEHSGPPLDFFLPDSSVYIECKQFHSDRIGGQMAKAANVIVIQGSGAAHQFAQMIDPTRQHGERISETELMEYLEFIGSQPTEQ